MNKDKLLYWGSLVAACIAILIGSIAIAKHNRSLQSSPVEETYHRQLVITLDSVLDAHLNAATLKELKDKDSAGISDRTHYEKYFVPME